MSSPSIKDLSSSVQDNGRRGMPRAGCDCVQCFGYCLIDHDEAYRQRLADAARLAQRERAPLDFKD